jgi:hypothetical protein
MLSLSRGPVLVRLDEKKYNCVVCSQNGTKDSVIDQIELDTKTMVRDPEHQTWKGMQVWCIRYKSPKNQFENAVASRVMQQKIIGHALLISPDPNFKAASLKVEEPKKASWLSMAKALPKVLNLETLKETIQPIPVKPKNIEEMDDDEFEEAHPEEPFDESEDDI